METWPRRQAAEVPPIGYALPEYQTKRWPSEVLIEGWFPPQAKEHDCFRIDEDASEDGAPTQRHLHPGQLEQFAERAGREQPGTNSTVGPSADAGWKERGGRRAAEVCLDIPFHRTR